MFCLVSEIKTGSPNSLDQCETQKTLDHLWLIPAHYLRIVNDYNKITHGTVITETTKTATTKIFSLFQKQYLLKECIY